MIKVLAALLLMVVHSSGQKCFEYETPMTATGTIVRIDEAGYNKFLAPKLPRPLCVNAHSEDGRDYPAASDVSLIQIYSPGGPEVVQDRLEKLAGYCVTIQGTLTQIFTGYQKTSVVAIVQSVEPLDSTGEAALRRVPPVVKVKDVSAYEVSVSAGRKFAMKARDSITKEALTPVNEYASHFLTGGEVVWVNCRHGYELMLLSVEPKDATICVPAAGCTINAFQKIPTVLQFRCSKAN